MPNFFDYDDSNGNYDLPTSADYERWEDERLLREDRLRRDNATAEEREDPYFDVPY